jgi:DNA topoisomerase-3
LTADAGTFRLAWVDKNNNSRCSDKPKIEDIASKLNEAKKEAIVTDVTKTAKKKLPPKLYDLTELQRDANKRYGYTPKETLSIMQKLYEEHKALTYPRTDSRYLSSDIVPTLPDRIKACSSRPYAKICSHILRSPIRPNENYVDNAKVSDHHAIIPTEQAVDYMALNEKERKIYDLVIIRFLSVFYPPFLYEQTSLKVKIGGETFTANGKTVLSQGFREVSLSDDSDDEEETETTQALPQLKPGDRLPIKAIRLTENKTSPPPPFNEATLLSAMESPAKYMETTDKALAETLKNTGGLGTVATRADIIEKLFDNFLIEKKGRDIFSTSKGRQLLTLVPKELKSPELTGVWEQKLLSISKGQLKRADFISEIKKYTKDIIYEIKSSTASFRHDNLSTTKCTECGRAKKAKCWYARTGNAIPG